MSGAEVGIRHNPIFNDNRVKLGVMAFNCSHGSTVNGFSCSLLLPIRARASSCTASEPIRMRI